MRLTPRLFRRPTPTPSPVSRTAWWHLLPRPWAHKSRPEPRPAIAPPPRAPTADLDDRLAHRRNLPMPGNPVVSLDVAEQSPWALLDRYDRMWFVPEFLRQFNDDLSVTNFERQHETTAYWNTPHEVRDRMYSIHKEASVVNLSRDMSVTNEERYHERVEARVAHSHLVRLWDEADNAGVEVQRRLLREDAARIQAWHGDLSALSPSQYLARNRLQREQPQEQRDRDVQVQLMPASP